MTKTKAVIFDGVNSAKIGLVELPECGDTQIVAESIYSFVSPGTELRVLGGHYGAKDNYPFVPGYSTISRVTAIGKNVRDFKIGDLISCRNSLRFKDCNIMWGGQAAAHVYPTTGEDRPVLLPPVDDLLPYSVAEVASISLRGIEAAAPKKGETAVVIGQGLIGQFSAAFLMMYGCRTVVCDIDPVRLAHARKCGVSEVVDLRDPDAEERVKMIGNGGFDIVVESSGTTPGALLSYKLIRRKPQNYGEAYKVEPIRFYGTDWPRLVMQANYIADIQINPFSFFNGEGVIVLTPSDRGIEERQRVIEYIRTGQLNAMNFIEKICTPDQMPEAYAKLQTKEYFSVTCKWN